MSFFHSVLMILCLICSVCLSACNTEDINHSSVSVLTGAIDEDVTERGTAIGDTPPTLLLKRSTEIDGLTKVALHYHKREGQVAPRTAEIFISHPEGLVLLNSEKGDVLQSAMKDLIVQEPNSGVLRVIIMGTGNLNTLESGVLAHLTLQGNLSADDELFIQERRQYFAPANANIGVTLESSDHPQNLREGK